MRILAHFRFIAFLGTIFLFSSCHVHHRGQHRNLPPGQYERMQHGKKGKRIPPGQHKKMHNHKDAKHFAPGQQKK